MLLSVLWKEFVLDFVRLFCFGEYFMVVINEYSCILEVEIVVFIFVGFII